MRVSIEDGKYEYVCHEDGSAEALRYGERWRDCLGDKFTYCMASEIESLRQQLADQKAYYEQVMVDGGKRIKDLMDQNESLRKANKECVEYFNEMQKDLAAIRLQDERLREALDRIGITSLDARQIADDALAIPSDASALDALEAMIAKAGEVMRDLCAKEAEIPVFAADAIRALPPVKLEDLK